MTAMGGRATDAATENGWQVFLPDPVLRSVEDEGTHRDRISSIWLLRVTRSGTTLVVIFTINFNDSVVLMLFARRLAFGAMTFWMTPMRILIRGGCNHSQRMDSECGSGETVDVKPNSA